MSDHGGGGHSAPSGGGGGGGLDVGMSGGTALLLLNVLGRLIINLALLSIWPLWLGCLLTGTKYPWVRPLPGGHHGHDDHRHGHHQRELPLWVPLVVVAMVGILWGFAIALPQQELRAKEQRKRQQERWQKYDCHRYRACDGFSQRPAALQKPKPTPVRTRR